MCEEYVENQGIDVKIYTVGPAYGHAKARKSPTVDGKVDPFRNFPDMLLSNVYGKTCGLCTSKKQY